MSKKGNWFSSVKKALSSDSKEQKDSKSIKPKKKWFGKQKQKTLDSNHTETAVEPSLPEKPILIDEQNKQTKDVDIPELVPVSQFAGKSTEEVAAIKIQKSFRGYQARRALRGLRGLVRLKSLIEGPTTKRQVANTMLYLQTLARLQSQIHSRRLRMSEENQCLQRQILHKRAKELENLSIGEEWSDTLQSKEQIEANLLKKFEAAMRRERALAYSFTHQQTWKNQPKSTNPMFLDPTNLGWGWSWLERWMAARPWENNKGSHNNTKNNIAGEINKSYAKYQLNSSKGFQSPAKKLNPPDDDLKSIGSVQSEMTRRHSVGPASVRDDDSLASSASVPSYMVATKSARAKSRFQSPAGPERSGNLEKVSPGMTKKRLSLSPSSVKPRRYSAPPKVNNESIVSEKSMQSSFPNILVEN